MRTLLALVLVAACGYSVAADTRSRIEVEDLARFATVGDTRSLTSKEGSGAIGTTSPDGRKVAVVVRRGDPDEGVNRAAIIVYSVDDLRDLTRPVSGSTVAELSSATNHQPIAFVKWLPGSDGLVFAGTRDARASQVFRVNLQTSKPDPLTEDEAQLLWFDVVAAKQWLVTIRATPSRPLGDDPGCRNQGCLVTADRLVDAERGVRGRADSLSVVDVSTGNSRSVPQDDATDQVVDFCLPELSGGVSPDGRYGFRKCRPRASVVRPHWYEYEMLAPWTTCRGPVNPRCFQHGVLIDFDTGRSVVVPDVLLTPLESTDPLWIEGGRYLILPAALESLAGVSKTERTRRATQFSVMLLDPASQEVVRVARLDRSVSSIASANWDEASGTLTLNTLDAPGSPLQPVHYQRKGRQWQRVHEKPSTSRKTAPVVELSIKQGLNEPPVLVSRVNGIERVVLDPNPWLHSKKLGRVEPVEWPSINGRTWRGGIYFPPDYSAGKRYPLAIQTHGFDADRFDLQGITRNFPGQALAAHDIVVVQVDENEKGVMGTPAEWPTVQHGYEALVGHLDRRGIIDPSRVGIMGWSRTGAQVGYTLTHSSIRFAAAAFVNTADIGWLWYVSAGAPRDVDNYYGAAPFGEGLQAWRQYAPTFNLDRVQTPLFMWGEGEVRGLWDWYAGLRYLGKPVEYWIGSDGAHDLFQVGQRVRANQLLVDWFRFWLKGEEAPGAGAEEQYRRWRALRVPANPAN